MEFTTHHPTKLNEHTVTAIANLAGIGFGQGNTPSMISDTLEHLSAADCIMLAHDGNTLAAFAMTKERLWRQNR